MLMDENKTNDGLRDIYADLIVSEDIININLKTENLTATTFNVGEITIGSRINFASTAGAFIVGLNPPGGFSILSSATYGDSILASSKNLYIGPTSGAFETTLVGKVQTTGSFQGVLNVENGIDPKFRASNTSGEILVGVTTFNGGFFPTTSTGDACIRSSRSIFLGPSDANAFSTFLMGNVHLNGALFKFNQGPWTPTLKYLRSSGAINCPYSVQYDFQQGYYTRTGNNVTCFFDFQFSLFGKAPGESLCFVAIGNLPVRIGFTSVTSDIKSSAPLSVGSFPNGLAGVVPIVGVPVFGGGFVAHAYEAGYSVPLYLDAIAQVSYGSWTSDGYHIQISTDSDVYVPSLTIPPWSNIISSHAPLPDFHISANTLFTGCRFSGTVTYMSDY